MNQFTLVRAIVSDNKDPEHMGRVKVRFPYLGGAAARRESIWARIARGVSHSGAGDWMLPEIGDEVLVGFEYNRTEQPIVIGALYSRDVVPPQSGRAGDRNSNGKNNLRFLRTKSGHTLVFDDLEGSEMVELKDRIGNRLLLDSAKKKISVEDTSGNLIEMTDAGIKIKSSKEIKIEAASEVKVESPKVVVAGGKISLGEAAAESLVKGNLFMTLFNAHTHPAPGGSTGVPATPMQPAMLSQKVKTE